jgi:hypothetical protein
MALGEQRRDEVDMYRGHRNNHNKNTTSSKEPKE